MGALLKLAIVQYAGDYREAFERFARGGKATYQAQRYSVDFVGSLAQHLEAVTVICAICGTPYDVTLDNNVRAIGLGLSWPFHPRELLSALDRVAPDRLLLTTPMVPVLRWARDKRVKTATAFADSFRRGGLRQFVRNRLLARELNSRNVEFVGNHQIGACLSLRRIGVNASKIVPWDWPPSHRPDDYPAREWAKAGIAKILYVGSITEAKGVGDLLRAMRQLTDVEATIVGHHDGSMAELASGMNVRFAGPISNEDVPEAMRSADIVVIPSRHEYPEGLPLTIYEALAVRTPIVASDHPMFKGVLVDEESALIFPAGDSEQLTCAIKRLSSDADLYRRLSINSTKAWQALQIPVSFGDLVEKWLSGDSDWLERYRIDSGLYDHQITRRATGS